MLGAVPPRRLVGCAGRWCGFERDYDVATRRLELWLRSRAFVAPRCLELGMRGDEFGTKVDAISAGLAPMRREMLLARGRVRVALGAGRRRAVPDVALIAKHALLVGLDALHALSNQRRRELGYKSELALAPCSATAADWLVGLLLCLDPVEAVLAKHVPAGNCVSHLARRRGSKRFQALGAAGDAEDVLV